MPQFKMKKIDAFTGPKSVGNPAAAIYIDRGEEISEEQMLRIAKEMKDFVCEVAYVFEDNGELKIRYFSSEREVQFCGHATIALMYDYFLMHQDQKELEIITNKGKLVVENKISSQNAVFICAPVPEFIDNKISLSAVAEALNLKEECINKRYPIGNVNAGNQVLCVALDAMATLINLNPDFDTLKRFCHENHLDAINVFTNDLSDSQNVYRTRVFAAPFGYLEDLATGSGNASLGYFLRALNFWDGSPLTLRQGPDALNPNIVRMMIKKDESGQERVFFGGQATLRIEGTYFI